MLPFAIWLITLRIVSEYGREADIRSCVLRILEVATISIAFVIFCVLRTLAILVLISFAPAIIFLR